MGGAKELGFIVRVDVTSGRQHLLNGTTALSMFSRLKLDPLSL